MHLQDTFGIELEAIALSDLQIADEYQRTPANNKRVLKIKENFNGHIMGVIRVAKRGDSWWVIDGQHRIAALKAKHPSMILRNKPIKIVCQVMPTESLAQEALTFVDCNKNQKEVNPDQLFKAMLAAGSEDHIFIRDRWASIGRDNGIQMQFNGQGRTRLNVTRAAGASWDAFSRIGKDGFKQLITLVNLYQRPDHSGVIEPQALQADFIRGLAYFLNKRDKEMFPDDEIVTGLKHGMSAAEITKLANDRNKTDALVEGLNMNGKTSREKSFAALFEYAIPLGIKKSRRKAA